MTETTKYIDKIVIGEVTYTLRGTITDEDKLLKFLGVTTTALTDDDSTHTTISISGENHEAETGDVVVYGSDEFVFNGEAWQRFGRAGTLGALSGKDTASATYTPAGTNSDSAVSFLGGTSSAVLTSSVTATVPKTVSTGKYLTATASGTEIDTTTTAAVTGYNNPSDDTFVKSYPGSTKKLETTSIQGISSVGTASSWQFTVNELTNTLTISGSNGTAPTAASAVTVATGKVATIDSNGADVLVGLGTATTGSALTALGDPSTQNVAKTVSIKTQPTITLTSANTSSSGAIQYVQQIGEGGTNDVTFDTSTSGHTVNAITNIGTGTAAAQTFTGTAATITVS